MPKRKLTYEDRVGNLDHHIAEGTLIRKDWGDGFRTACLLAALSPEVATSTEASSCPASVMPKWLAQLTPAIDDYGSLKAWPGMVRRYAALARRWHVLDPLAWERIKSKVYLHVLDSIGTTNSEHVVAVKNWVQAGRPEDQRKILRSALYKEYKKHSWQQDLEEEQATLVCVYHVTGSKFKDLLDAMIGTRQLHTRTFWDRLTTSVFDAIQAEIETCPS